MTLDVSNDFSWRQKVVQLKVTSKRHLEGRDTKCLNNDTDGLPPRNRKNADTKLVGWERYAQICSDATKIIALVHTL